MSAILSDRFWDRFSPRLLWCCFLLFWGQIVFPTNSALGQLEFERPPIDYNITPVNDRVAKLQQRIDRGELTLRFDEKHGYLPDVLKQLDISPSSQILVFSKTSFQLRCISPKRPRALYFDESTYIGWVQGGTVVEVASVDPQQGTIFYTLDQKKVKKPKFVRDRGQCLICHASSRTAAVPGLLLRSVYTGRTGHPLAGTRTFTTDYRSPFIERWGGWYVSGTHGALRHMGNVISSNHSQPEKLDMEFGANVTDLSKIVDIKPYLKPHSDLVALMILEHQTRMQNLIIRANFEARSAIHYDEEMNRLFKRPRNFRTESTKRRIAAVTSKLLECLLFSDEFKLTSKVSGSSNFAKEFARPGLRDHKDRSLRDLDLQTRLMKYPCSYMIYSKSFDSLPEAVKSKVYFGLWEILKGKNTSKKYSHLSKTDRRTILEILRTTKKDLPVYWKS